MFDYDIRATFKISARVKEVDIVHRPSTRIDRVMCTFEHICSTMTRVCVMDDTES